MTAEQRLRSAGLAEVHRAGPFRRWGQQRQASRRSRRSRASCRGPPHSARRSRLTAKNCATRPGGWRTPTPSCMTAARFTTFPNDEGYDELVLVGISRSGRSALTTCCRSSASRTSVTCPATASSACPSSPGWSTVRARSADPRAADQAGRRLAGWCGCAARRRRGGRGRAPVHDAARSQATGTPPTSALLGTLRDGPALACGIPRAGRRHPIRGPLRKRAAVRIGREPTMTEQLCDRRSGPGRRQGRRDAARRRLPGPITLIGDESRAAVRAAAAVEGLPARQGASGTRSTCTRGLVRRQRRGIAARRRVTAIDRAAHRWSSHDGRAIRYDRLLIAHRLLAAPARRARRRPRRRALPPEPRRTRSGSREALRERRQGGRRRRGLDRAGDRRGRQGVGCEVTIVETAAVPLQRALGPEAGRSSSRTCTGGTASTCDSAVR